jgi:hypothetical protein
VVVPYYYIGLITLLPSCVIFRNSSQSLVQSFLGALAMELVYITRVYITRGLASGVYLMGFNCLMRFFLPSIFRRRFRVVVPYYYIGRSGQRERVACRWKLHFFDLPLTYLLTLLAEAANGSE